MNIFSITNTIDRSNLIGEKALIQFVIYLIYAFVLTSYMLIFLYVICIFVRITLTRVYKTNDDLNKKMGCTMSVNIYSVFSLSWKIGET